MKRGSMLGWRRRRKRPVYGAEAQARRLLGVPRWYPEKVVTDYRQEYFELLQGQLWPHDTDAWFINLYR